MAQNSVRRCQIGGLQLGNSDVLIVALIISKSNPKKVTMKKDGTERWVTSFTLRDSPSDMINMSIWSDSEEAVRLKEEFHIGSCVEVVRPRLLQRDMNSGREANYSPQVTSPFQLSFQEGRTVLCPYLGEETNRLKGLLCIPSKASSTFLSLNDIVTNSGGLRGHFVDILAAVRKVGVERKFSGKDGDDRGLREVRLFDQTADSLVLKLWDFEYIRQADDWIPREVILFLADVRVDWDDWKSAYTLTCTSKTVITVNPDTVESADLIRFAQLADFSSISRLDQFATTIHPENLTKVVNVVTVNTMKEKIVGADEAMQAVCLYGFLSRFDIDCPDSVKLRCGRCCGPLSADEEICVSIDCKEYKVSGMDKMIPSQQYFVRADVSDETGTLYNLKVSDSFLCSHFGSPADFVKLSSHTKTAYKWQIFLKPIKMIMALMLPTGDSRNFTAMIVETFPVTLGEVCARMPTPTI